MVTKNKVNNRDYSQKNLPKSWWEKLLFTLRNQRKIYFYLGILAFLFFLPILLGFSFYNVLMNALYNSFRNEASSLTGDALKELTSAYQTSYRSYTDLFAWALILGIVLFSFYLSGLSRVIRDLMWGELFFFKDSFRKGISSNWKKTCVMSLFIGVINLIVTHIYILPLDDILRILPYSIFVLVFLPVFILFVLLNDLYNESLWTLVKVSLTLYIKSFLRVVLSSFLLLLPYSLLFLPNLFSPFSIAICYPIFLLLIVFYFPISTAFTFSFLIPDIDEYINKKSYPIYYRKGLH